MSVSVVDFEVDVIQQSHRVPVVVDFWAAWCAPCRILGPILEKLETASNGSWKLAKVDVDQNPDLAGQFRVQGIPAVKMIHRGELIADFVGALPESEVRRWLDQYLPNENRDQLSTAMERMDAGDREGAIRILEGLDLPEARKLLAQTILFERPDSAEQLIRDLDQHDDTVARLLTILDLLRIDLATLPAGPPLEPLRVGVESLRQRDYETALQKLIDSMTQDKTYHDGIARRLCVGIFQALGDSHPLTVRFRPQFSMTLH